MGAGEVDRWHASLTEALCLVHLHACLPSKSNPSLCQLRTSPTSHPRCQLYNTSLLVARAGAAAGGVEEAHG